MLFVIWIYCKPTINVGFYIQPYLQNVTQQSITILWWTENSFDTNFVYYGESEYLDKREASNEYVPAVGKFLHEVKINKLKPETVYHYYVLSGGNKSRKYSFQTAVNRQSDFHFVVLGDGRTDDDRVINNHRAVTKLAWQQHPDIAFHLGDLVYSGDQLHWDRFWRRIATASDMIDPGLSFASHIPYYLAVGNHEIYSKKTNYNKGNLDSTMARFKAYVGNPTNNSQNPLWEERYYAFTYGAARFIILDTNNTSDDSLDNHKYLPDGSTPDWEPESEQYIWLEQELKQAQQNNPLTFVMMHPAPYSRGEHGNPEEVQSGWHIRVLDRLFRNYGVDAVFCSHDHLVERCLTGPAGFEENFDDADTNNLNYIVMGNSGESSRAAGDRWQTWMDIQDIDSAPYYSRYFYDWVGEEHFSFLDVQINNLKNGQWQAIFQIIRDDGKCFDRLSIIRKCNRSQKL